jgi:uncharacterized protein (DUF924 family)
MDFHINSYGSVCQVEAISEAAKLFAADNFPVEGWQGIPECFMTDWRVAQNLAEQLIEEGWDVEEGA